MTAKTDTPTSAAVPSPDFVRKALRAVKDPELNLNIMDIGLVYDVEISNVGQVHIRMTLTSPGCPAGTEIIDDVKKVVSDLEGVTGVEVELVWDPYWTPERMDPRVRAFLGF
ncbi:MAG: metal-sulfur cluster assembly factor [Gemmatimonadales bacterium]